MRIIHWIKHNKKARRIGRIIGGCLAIAMVIAGCALAWYASDDDKALHASYVLVAGGLLYAGWRDFPRFIHWLTYDRLARKIRRWTARYLVGIWISTLGLAFMVWYAKKGNVPYACGAIVGAGLLFLAWWDMKNPEVMAFVGDVTFGPSIETGVSAYLNSVRPRHDTSENDAVAGPPATKPDAEFTVILLPDTIPPPGLLPAVQGRPKTPRKLQFTPQCMGHLFKELNQALHETGKIDQAAAFKLDEARLTPFKRKHYEYIAEILRLLGPEFKLRDVEIFVTPSNQRAVVSFRRPPKKNA